jgi:hypothetical protein
LAQVDSAKAGAHVQGTSVTYWLPDGLQFHRSLVVIPLSSRNRGKRTMVTSPYDGISPSGWAAKTTELIAAHPADPDELKEIVLETWDSIFSSKLGINGFQIGKDIFPAPQMMGFFLHALIPLECAARYPGTWREDQATNEKDLVHVPDDAYSIEIKTSSNPNQIFGNRSYAQKPASAKKSKSGYYLAVNFEKFTKGSTARPGIRKVRFGWLDHTDWIGQKAATGQQARLSPDVEGNKLLVLYKA